MNTLTLLVGVLLCVTLVTARHFEDRDTLAEEDDQNEGSSRHRDHSIERHRRRRWQMGYGYDYPPPQHGYYPERRDYDRNQQDLNKIVKLLEEITVYLRQPPPPPQPIYIPYPVLYPVQYAPCSPTDVKNITTRFPEMEDVNQNWGFVPPKDDNDDEDGARPISFEPIRPARPLKRQPPTVEHGTLVDGQQPSTAAPNFVDSALPSSLCNAAILSCCANTASDQKRCFVTFGCPSMDPINACSQKSISSALESFKNAYSPVHL